MSVGHAISGSFDDLLTALACQHEYGAWHLPEDIGRWRRKCAKCATTEIWFGNGASAKLPPTPLERLMEKPS